MLQVNLYHSPDYNRSHMLCCPRCECSQIDTSINDCCRKYFSDIGFTFIDSNDSNARTEQISLQKCKNIARCYTCQISKLNNRLIVLNQSNHNRKVYHPSTTRLDEALLSSILEEHMIPFEHTTFEKFQKVFNHSDFDQFRYRFIIHALSTSDEDGRALFSQIPHKIQLFILNYAQQMAIEGDLHSISFDSRKRLFLEALPNEKCLFAVAKLFPEDLKMLGREIVKHGFLNGFSPALMTKFTSLFASEYDGIDLLNKLVLQIEPGFRPNAQFIEEFKQLSKEHQQIVYDVAFVMNNRFLVEPSETTVEKEKYEINLMWIHPEKCEPDQLYFNKNRSTPKESLEHFCEKFANPITKWIIGNPGTSVNFWYDSNMTTEEIIENSCEAIKDKLAPELHECITFRDIHTLHVIEKLGEKFSPSLPLFFKVDFLKALISDSTLTETNVQYSVFADLDVTPINREDLFDKRTMEYLDFFGIVMAKETYLNNYENSFHIMNKNNSELMKLHRSFVCIKGLRRLLYEGDQLKEQEVYDCYIDMMRKLLLKKELISDTHFFYNIQPDGKVCQNKPMNSGTRQIVPTKAVEVPKSHFIFNKK